MQSLESVDGGVVFACERPSDIRALLGPPAPGPWATLVFEHARPAAIDPAWAGLLVPLGSDRIIDRPWEWPHAEALLLQAAAIGDIARTQWLHHAPATDQALGQQELTMGDAQDARKAISRDAYGAMLQLLSRLAPGLPTLAASALSAWASETVADTAHTRSDDDELDALRANGAGLLIALDHTRPRAMAHRAMVRATGWTSTRTIEAAVARPDAGRALWTAAVALKVSQGVVLNAVLRNPAAWDVPAICTAARTQRLSIDTLLTALRAASPRRRPSIWAHMIAVAPQEAAGALGRGVPALLAQDQHVVLAPLVAHPTRAVRERTLRYLSQAPRARASRAH